MSNLTNEEVVRAYMQALANKNLDLQGQLRHLDWYADWPQSGERVRGDANSRAMDEQYPGGLPDVRTNRIVGSEDRWVVTPVYSVQRVVGSGDSWWGDGSITYPDGSTWFLAILIELRDSLIYRETTYFAEPFEAPEWRKPFVEQMEPKG